MIEIGTSVKATIESIQPYGVFLRFGTDSLFVPVTNISWRQEGQSVTALSQGGEMEVLVLRYNYGAHRYLASRKHLFPETNPYRELSRLPAHTVFKATVKIVDKNGIAVQLDNSCIGDLRPD